MLAPLCIVIRRNIFSTLQSFDDNDDDDDNDDADDNGDDDDNYDDDDHPVLLAPLCIVSWRNILSTLQSNYFGRRALGNQHAIAPDTSWSYILYLCFSISIQIFTFLGIYLHIYKFWVLFTSATNMD